MLVDTSALYALLDGGDERSSAAINAFEQLREQGEALLVHNYVVVEASALVGRRLGPAAQRALHGDVLPLFSIHWVDQALHNAAVIALLAGRSSASLVDRVSFELMRRRRIDTAFAFDRDFRGQGFRTIP